MTHTHKPHPVVIVAALAVHVTCWTLTWRDLAGRTDAQVRGRRVLWRVASALNTTGSIAYWLFGRQPR